MFRHALLRSGSSVTIVLATSIGVLLWFKPAFADNAGLFVSCQACHGKQGEGSAQVGAPNIAGMEAWYVERQLDNFAHGRRGSAAGDKYGAQMRAAVAVLKSGEERKQVAAHIAGLKKVGAGGTAPKGDLAKGSTQYNALCSSCHGASGKGNQALGAPNLVGVDLAYLQRQYAQFQRGERGSHAEDKPGKQMAAISKLLHDTKAEKDVFAYIATLKP